MYAGSSFGGWLHEPRFIYPRIWRDIAEEEGIGRGPTDTFQLEAAKAIFENGSGLVVGAGGTGKSKIVKLLVALYKEAGIKTHVIAYTHVQAQNYGGDTVLSDLHRHPRAKRRVVIIDEAGQVPLSLWGALNTYRAIGCRLIVLGDFAGQLPPITDHDRFDLWKQFPHSQFMHDACGGLRITLNKFRRCKLLQDGTYGVADYDHFCFVRSLYPSLTDDEDCLLPNALYAGRTEYAVTGREVATTLVVTNAHRLYLNAYHNDIQARRHDATRVYYKGDNPRCQTYQIWPGIILQAVITERTKTYNIKNALRLRVLTIAAGVTTLALIDDAGQRGTEFMTTEELVADPRWDPITIATELVSHKFVPVHAITYDSSQARTLHGGVRLAQTDHPRMTLRKLIVGLGRAPAGCDVQVQ